MPEANLDRTEYQLSLGSEAMDVTAVHAFLSQSSYWAEGIPIEVVAKAIQGSLCLGLFHQARQVAFARVITDRATFAYLADVYVLVEHRGRGLASWLMAEVVRHPDLQGLRRFVLATRDAHSLYSRFGFTPLAHPEFFMEINRPGLYLRPSSATERAP